MDYSPADGKLISKLTFVESVRGGVIHLRNVPSNRVAKMVVVIYTRGIVREKSVA